MKWHSIVLSTLVIGSVAAAQGSPIYTFVDVGPQDGAFQFSEALAGADAQGAGDAITSGPNPTNHAVIFGSPTSYSDLNPLGFLGSKIYGMSGGVEVGTVSPNGPGPHAAMWRGTVGSFVDLNPVGISSSQAFGVYGNQIVGTAQGAAIWDASTGLLVAQLSSGTSAAYATDGAHQVGSVQFSDLHAMLWTGTSASAVDLNPIGWQHSEALGVSEGTEVGYVRNGTDVHAVTWSGTSESVVDLNPLGYVQTEGTAIFGETQVGFGASSDGISHALLWRGSAGSVLDLNTFLPNGYLGAGAYGVDRYGNVYGQAQTALGAVHAAIWLAPEPSGLLFAAGVVAFLVLRRGAAR